MCIWTVPRVRLTVHHCSCSAIRRTVDCLHPLNPHTEFRLISYFCSNFLQILFAEFRIDLMKDDRNSFMNQHRKFRPTHSFQYWVPQTQLNWKHTDKQRSSVCLPQVHRSCDSFIWTLVGAAVLCLMVWSGGSQKWWISCYTLDVSLLTTPSMFQINL